jgi:hypothetical protein
VDLLTPIVCKTVRNDRFEPSTASISFLQQWFL